MRSGPDAVGRRHAVVIGMHRSGTSATAHTLVELGLSTPDPGDLIQPGPHNERGYWESQTVARFDESVLRHLGGTWAAPPSPAAGWEGADDAGIRALRARATELATSVFGRPPAVMKDPRLCVTLPLWRTVLPAGPVAVLVYRDPMEVARSLQERDGFPLTLGLALWHRYVRQSLVSVDRLPVLVVDYARSLEEPRATVDDLTMFLIAHGITPGADRSELAAQVLSRDLQHHREGRPDETLEKDLQPLLDVLRDRLGAHGAWSVPELPPEPGWVEDVIRLTWAGLAVTAAMQNAQHELKWVKKSRLFRATHALWRVTRTGPVLSPVEEGAPTADPGSNGAASAPAVSA